MRRLSLPPFTMVEIGGRPILWHIMNILALHGITEFIIALGYRAEVIKQYFLNFYAINNDISVDLATGAASFHRGGNRTPWTVHLVDTGLHTQTGGRLKGLQDRCNIYEAEPHYGGHMCSMNGAGFTWDDRPHVRFTDTEHIQVLFAESVCGSLRGVGAYCHQLLPVRGPRGGREPAPSRTRLCT